MWSWIKWLLWGWWWGCLTADQTSKPVKYTSAQEADDDADQFGGVAGQFDDALSGLLLTVDAMHSATQSHIKQLNMLNTHSKEVSDNTDSDIERSKEILQNVELTLVHNKNVLVKALQSLQQTCQNFDINLEEEMPSTRKYIYQPGNDEEVVERYLDVVLEKSTTIRELQERVDNLEKCIETPVANQPKCAVQVQVCKHADSSVLTDATELLMEHLNNVTDVKVECTTLTNTESAQSDVPLLILCIHSSRLGTDALNAIKGVINASKTALVIVHYKEEHALTETPSKQILVGSEFDQIGGLFDIAYTKEKGVYSCKMNNRAQKEINTFISR